MAKTELKTDAANVALRAAAIVGVMYGFGFLLMPYAMFQLSGDPGVPANPGPMSVAITIASLYAAARLIAPEGDWRWLASVRSRLAARATPLNRLDRLVPGWETLDLGIKLTGPSLP